MAQRRFLDGSELAGGEIDLTRVLRGIVIGLFYNIKELKISSVTLYRKFRYLYGQKSVAPPKLRYIEFFVIPNYIITRFYCISSISLVHIKTLSPTKVFRIVVVCISRIG
jgi:hypothetical protein